MKEWSNRIRFVCSYTAGALALFLMTGCANDLYQPCDLDPTSADPAVAECAASGSANEDRGCVVRNQVQQCDTGVCGRYQGTSPFCTMLCTDDADCPSGECREFVFQSGEKYCVQLEDLE